MLVRRIFKFLLDLLLLVRVLHNAEGNIFKLMDHNNNKETVLNKYQSSLLKIILHAVFLAQKSSRSNTVPLFFMFYLKQVLHK